MEQWGSGGVSHQGQCDKAQFDRLLCRHGAKRATCAVAATASTPGNQHQGRGVG
jgi:hypothetical protein